MTHHSFHFDDLPPAIILCTNASFGVCVCVVAKQCSDPGTPPGARQIGDSYSEGKKVTYECTQDGFSLTSDEPLTCELQGGVARWDRSLPECVGT